MQLSEGGKYRDKRQEDKWSCLKTRTTKAGEEGKKQWKERRKGGRNEDSAVCLHERGGESTSGIVLLL